MTVIAPARLRLGLAVLGGLYGIPLLVTGNVVGGAPGVVLTVLGIALSVVAMGRAFRISLSASDHTLVVRNRWRTVAVEIDAVTRLEPVTAWWMPLTRTATLDLLGVRSSQRRLIVPAMATLGLTLESPPVLALQQQLDPAEGRSPS